MGNRLVLVTLVLLCSTLDPVSGAGAADPAATGPDFNADGYADLVVAAPGEDLGRTTDAGVVHVLYGSADGVRAEGNQVWSQDSAGVERAAERFDDFGGALGWGDFDADGFDDLVVGAPRDGETQKFSGVVHVLYGTAAGLSAARNQAWDQDVPGVEGIAERSDGFGSAVVAADFDGDGFDDLAIGIPGESPPDGAGAVQVIRGSASGLTAEGDAIWGQPVGEPGMFDGFGETLAVGDLDGDGHPDLAIGATRRAVNGVALAGAVNVLYGTADGLGTARAQEWNQAAPGVPGHARSSDGFGTSLAIGDLDGDGFDDLAVGVQQGATGRSDRRGCAIVLYGTSDGLTSARAQRWSKDAPRVPGRGAPDDYVAAVAVTDIDADGHPELVLGIPGEVFMGDPVADRILVLPGTDAGPVADGARLWGQNSPGVKDETETLDEFGNALSSGDFDGDGYHDVAIGVPGEKVTEVGSHSGAVTLLYGGPQGLSGKGDQLWAQGTDGIGDRPEHLDGFGRVLVAGGATRVFGR